METTIIYRGYIEGYTGVISGHLITHVQMSLACQLG